MELKAGYKQTEVGVIPEDWDTPFLGDIVSSMQLGGNYKNDERQTDWPLIKMGNLGRGEIKLNRLEFINSGQTPAARDLLKKGDILFNTRNTLDLVGKVSIWRSELPEAYFNSNIARIDFNQRRVASKRYINYALNTPIFISMLRGIATGTTSVAAIYGRDLVKLQIPLPSPTEQRAIAKALSDADALIESLEQLLTKKRQIKQGAMQELLTGERRLPGFEGGWEEKSLGMMGEFLKGSGVTRVQSQSGALACVRYGEIYTAHSDYIRTFYSWISKDAASHAVRLKQGDLLFAGSGETKEEIGKCVAFLDDIEAYAGGDIVILRSYDCDSLFLGYTLNTKDACRQKSSRGQGDAVVHISATALASVTVKIPGLNEQVAIASVISAMDNEITTLETQLQKARQIKQGMMQELLTGRIRLI